MEAFTPLDTEPFPELTPTPTANSNNLIEKPVHPRRRKSSNLRGDPRGDTNAPSLTTLFDRSGPDSPANSPVSGSGGGGGGVIAVYILT
jgi:hypothetical protein